MGWPFGRKPRGEREGGEKPRVIESAIPRDDERYGPAPPPPRTSHAPGVTVRAFTEIQADHLLRPDEGHAGFFLEGKEGGRASSALLVLTADSSPSSKSPPAPGDVLVWSAADDSSRDAARSASRFPAAAPPSSSFEELSRPPQQPTHHIRRDGLAGRGVPGLAGLRTLHAGGGLTVLRLGPPPGARWVFVGLKAVAVFSGKLTLVDGEEPRVVPAGHLALVAEPTATLYVEAGNDSALAVALGGATVVSALG